MTPSHTVVVHWPASPLAGTLEVAHGELEAARPARGAGSADGARFRFEGPGPCALAVTIRGARLETGGRATRLGVRVPGRAFTFFLRDVTAEVPLFVPAAAAAVTLPSDPRDYAAVEAAVRARGLKSYQQRLAEEPEESFAAAAAAVRTQVNETWLGLSRDIRTFRVNANFPAGCWGIVRPHLAGYAMPVSQKTFQGYQHPATRSGNLATLEYRFWVGRGSSVVTAITRRLEQGCLPILHGTQRDDDLRYELTAFVVPAETPLTADTLEGTPALVADGHCSVHIFTPDQQAEFERLEPLERARWTPLLLCVRVRGVNTAAVPRYAWFKAAALGYPKSFPGARVPTRHTPDGFSVIRPDGADLAIARQRVNGRPMAEPEQAILVPPGGAVEFELLIPHQPLPLERAQRLRPGVLAERQAECAAFWRAKLERGARVDLPEPRIAEMVRAGLLHLDLIAYGREPDGPLVPAIGQYAPLAFESMPIVLAFELFGRPDLARRALEFYFLTKLQPSGRLHNYAGSMGETGPALFLLGEHARLAGDRAWLERLAAPALKACDYLIGLRRARQGDAAQGPGRGLFTGGVCDNVIPESLFLNNAFACLGLRRTAEWLRAGDPARAEALAREAEAWRADILAAFDEAMARSPVVPLADGTWRSSAPPTAEGVGNYHLFCEGLPRFSHGVMHSDDVLGGPLWLAFLEALDPADRRFEDILHSQTELFMTRNVAMSQPNVSRHDIAHLRRGEIRAFLKTYYNLLAAMADRETYTWNEHTHGGGMHKTEEEAWFLLQTRWMLALEDGRDLHLLRGVPRAWLADGGRIAGRDLPTYFGRVSFEARTLDGGRTIAARYALEGGRPTARLRFRLPHPAARPPRAVAGGTYESAAETVVIADPPAAGELRLEW